MVASRRAMRDALTQASMLFVMAGLDPAIHVYLDGNKDMDARHKAGHDDLGRVTSAALSVINVA
jgi:hypothetical protein